MNQIRRKLQIWSHLLEKSLMENFIFYTGGLVCFYTQNQKAPSLNLHYVIRGLKSSLADRYIVTFRLK